MTAGPPDETTEAELARLGWNAAWRAAAAAADPTATWQPVRIAAEHRGAYHALGPGGSAWVELSGRAFHTADDKRALPSVGDWVLVERWPAAIAGTSAAIVRAVLPRNSFLVRRAAGQPTVPQPLAANVDIGLIVTSANADLSIARLDRYASLLRDGGITPIIALSKVDLVADPSQLTARLSALAPLAARIIPISIVTGTGLPELRALVGPGITCVLLGSSGVGKSSLLNAIAGTDQSTRGIRADARGRHTTTRRELFVAAPGTAIGGLWIDTPGMRELAQWVEADDDLAFDDIIELAQQCKFRDCRHRDEPGCAVRTAIPADRLSSYHKLTDERRTGATRQRAAGKIVESRKAKAKKPTPPSDD